MSILYFQGCVCMFPIPPKRGCFFSHPEFFQGSENQSFSIQCVFFWTKSVLKVGWWFQIFFIFTYFYPYLGEMIQFDKCPLGSWSWSTNILRRWAFPMSAWKILEWSQEADEVVVFFCVLEELVFEWHGSWMSLANGKVQAWSGPINWNIDDLGSDVIFYTCICTYM